MSDNNHICSNRCLGFEKNHGGCCTLDERDFIIGPHYDTQEFLNRLSKKFNSSVEFKDIFITHEEGSKLFPEKQTWNNPNSYPALKVDLNHPRKPCIFYNSNVRSCIVYDIRPNTCQSFYCDYLKNHLNEKL